MAGLMIAEQDRNCRSMMVEMLRDEGYMSP